LIKEKIKCSLKYQNKEASQAILDLHPIDTLTDYELNRLSHGGNKRFREYLKCLTLFKGYHFDCNFDTYISPSVLYYREVLDAEVENRLGQKLASQIKDISIELYLAAAKISLEKGMILADTKFEFGLDGNDQLVLMDEVLTPDSSRYWPAETYQPGSPPPSLDKQFLRDWLESTLFVG
jgi:hypothetical protein